MFLQKFLALSLCLCATPIVLPLSAEEDPSAHNHKYADTLRPAIRDYVSSGAYLGLGLGSELVREPEDRSERISLKGQPSASLVSRIGLNVRLGDDPEELPFNMRHQAEPHIARHPMNPDLVVGAFQEGRFTDGGAVNCGYAVSQDGGSSWSRALIPGLTTVSGGTFERASDPVAAVDHLGNIYLNTLGITPFPTGNRIMVSKSSDGGLSFDSPVMAAEPPGEDDFLDKNWIAVNSFADTATAGRVFTSFTNFRNDDTGIPIMGVYSDDGGESWSPQPIFVTPADSFCQGSQPVYLPDGDLAVVYWNFNNVSGGFGDDRIEVRISEDGGGVFGPPLLVVSGFAVYNNPVLRSGTFLPSATADRGEGGLFVTYQAVVGGIPKVMFTRSIDKGQTWTAPLAASNNPVGSSIASPAISVSPDGHHVTIIFYDTRDNPQDGNLFHLYLAESFDSGDTWEPNSRLSESPSNALLAPLTAGGRMLGDYLGVVPALGGQNPGVAIWIDTRTGSPDPFAVSIDRPFPDPFVVGEGEGDEIAGFPGWNASPWYGDYFTDAWPWVYHSQHGWQWVNLESGSQGIFLFDLGLNEWIFLNENSYRWFFLFGDTPGWVWSFPDGKPEERFFVRADSGCIFSAGSGCP